MTTQDTELALVMQEIWSIEEELGAYPHPPAEARMLKEEIKRLKDRVKEIQS